MVVCGEMPVRRKRSEEGGNRHTEKRARREEGRKATSIRQMDHDILSGAIT